MAIKYEAYTQSGQKIKGVLDTDSEEAAYEMLEQEQLVPYRMKPVRRSRTLVQVAPGLFRPRPKDIIDFTKQMVSLLNSGIPLRLALNVHLDQARSLGMKQALRQIIQDVEGGSRLSDAMSRHPTVFPDFYVRLLSVGEATGGVTATMSQLALYLERRLAVGNKVKSALTYPAITLGVAVVAIFILVRFSLPSLIGLLGEFGGQLPLTTELLIDVADFAQTYGSLVFIGIVAAVVLAAAYMRTPRGARVRDTILLKVPVVGKVILASNMFMLTSTLVTLLEAGVSPIEALRLTGEGLNNVTIREKLAEVTRLATEGTKLGAAFSMQPVFPSILSQGMVIGEMRGTQSETLHGLANYFQQETDRVVGSATELIQPAVILIVAGIVGFVAIAVISGIYSSLESIE